MSTTGTEIYNEMHAKHGADSARDEHHQVVSNALDNPEVKKRAYEDVKDLAENIRQIRTLFKQVDDDLTKFDGENFNDKDGKAIQLQTSWTPNIEVRTLLRAHHQLLTRFVWQRFETDLQATYEIAAESSNFLESKREDL